MNNQNVNINLIIIIINYCLISSYGPAQSPVYKRRLTKLSNTMENNNNHNNNLNSTSSELFNENKTLYIIPNKSDIKAASFSSWFRI